MLKAVVMPWWCGCCATRRGDVVREVVGCRERIDVDATGASEHGKIRSHVKGPCSCLSMSVTRVKEATPPSLASPHSPVLQAS
jgi:hypothetical protein